MQGKTRIYAVMRADGTVWYAGMSADATRPAPYAEQNAFASLTLHGSRSDNVEVLIASERSLPSKKVPPGWGKLAAIKRSQVAGAHYSLLEKADVLLQAITQSHTVIPALEAHEIEPQALPKKDYWQQRQQWMKLQQELRPELRIRETADYQVTKAVSPRDAEAARQWKAQQQQKRTDRHQYTLPDPWKGESFTTYAKRLRQEAATLVQDPVLRQQQRAELESRLQDIATFAQIHPVLEEHPELAIEMALGNAGRFFGESGSILDPNRIRVTQQQLGHGYVWYIGYAKQADEPPSIIRTNEVKRKPDGTPFFRPAGSWRAPEVDTHHAGWMRFPMAWQPVKEPVETNIYPEKRPLMVYAQLHASPAYRDREERQDMPGGVVTPDDFAWGEKYDHGHFLPFIQGGSNLPEENLGLEHRYVNRVLSTEVERLLREWLDKPERYAPNGVEVIYSVSWRHGRGEEAAKGWTGMDDNHLEHGYEAEDVFLAKHVMLRPMGSQRPYMVFTLPNTPLPDFQNKRFADMYPRLRLHDQTRIPEDYGLLEDTAARLGVEIGPDDEQGILGSGFLRYARSPMPLREAKILAEFAQPDGTTRLIALTPIKAQKIYAQYKRQGLSDEQMRDTHLPIRFLNREELPYIIQELQHIRQQWQQQHGEAAPLDAMLVTSFHASSHFAHWRSGNPVHLPPGLDKFGWSALQTYGLTTMPEATVQQVPCWRYSAKLAYPQDSRVVVALQQPQGTERLATVTPAEAEKLIHRWKQQGLSVEEMYQPTLPIRLVSPNEGQALLHTLQQQYPLPLQKGEEGALPQDLIPPFAFAQEFPYWRPDMPQLLPPTMGAASWLQWARQGITPTDDDRFAYSPQGTTSLLRPAWVRHQAQPNCWSLVWVNDKECPTSGERLIFPDEKLELQAVTHSQWPYLEDELLAHAPDHFPTIPLRNGRRTELQKIRQSVQEVDAPCHDRNIQHLVRQKLAQVHTLVA